MEKREKILQIFESSACLKSDQMLGYLNGSLFQEELRVVELHLASCNLCQDALEGLENHADAKVLIDHLSAPLLPPSPSNKSSVSATESFSPAKNLFPSSSKKSHTTPSLPKSTFTSNNHHQISREKNMSWLGIGGIAALLLLGGFLFWQYQDSGLDWQSFSIASNDVKKPTIIDSSTNDNDSVTKPAGQQKNNIAQRAATPATTSNATDSAKKAENAVAGNLNKTHHADSATTVVAATLKVKGDNSLIADERAGKTSNDSQNERSNSLAAANIKKAEPKSNTTSTTKTLAKPAETPTGSESIGSSDYQTGKSLFQKKQYASALLYLRSAAENDNDPHHVEAMYYSGLCNLQIGKTGRAKRLFKKVEKTDSPFAEKASEQLKQL